MCSVDILRLYPSCVTVLLSKLLVWYLGLYTEHCPFLSWLKWYKVFCDSFAFGLNSFWAISGSSSLKIYFYSFAIGMCQSKPSWWFGMEYTISHIFPPVVEKTLVSSTLVEVVQQAAWHFLLYCRNLYLRSQSCRMQSSNANKMSGNIRSQKDLAVSDGLLLFLLSCSRGGSAQHFIGLLLLLEVRLLVSVQ